MDVAEKQSSTSNVFSRSKKRGRPRKEEEEALWNLEKFTVYLIKYLENHFQDREKYKTQFFRTCAVEINVEDGKQV